MPWGDGGLSGGAPDSGGGGWGSGGIVSSGNAKTAPKKSGGGILGDIEHVGHVVASKAALAGHDIAAIPGGAVDFVNKGAVQPWKDFLTSGHVSSKTNHNIDTLTKQAFDSTRYTLNHPFADPFQTLMLASPALHGVGRVGAKVAGVDLRAPRLIQKGDTAVGMPPPSHNAGLNLIQRGYDKTLQRAINKEAAGRGETRLGAHAASRVGKQIKEAARPVQQMRAAPANDLAAAGKELRNRIGNHPIQNHKIAEHALRLTSENITAKEAAHFHALQAARGVAPKANLKLAKLYGQMDKQGMVVKDANGDVQINAAKFPKLAAVDAKLSNVQKLGEDIIRQHDLLSAAGAQSRIDRPGQIVRANLPAAQREGSIYGTQGRGFTTYKQLEKPAPRSPVSRAGGSVVGAPRPPSMSKEFKGTSLEEGKVPWNTTGNAAQRLRELIRHQNTSELRNRWVQTGSDTRRTSRDILVRKQGETAAPLTPEQEALLGRGKLTAPETEAASTTLREHLNDLIPGWNDDKIRRWEESHDIGAPAPKGYRWVDRKVVGDLNNAFADARGKLGKSFDNVNSMVTAQTVYYKIGHAGTRGLTNAALNLVEGSLKHSPKSYLLWKRLSEMDRLRAYAAAGQHGFNALPHEGTGKIARFATHGANFWARRFDAPFRFNSIAYQAAKEGYKTPAQFRDFLNKLEHPEGLSDVERARIENIAKRNNRENISYDRLSEKERRILARGLWFYPWVKGSASWTARSTLEHPFKAALAGQLATAGKKRQAQLGPLPSYENGLIPMSHGRVTDFSTFTPAATAGSLLQLPEYSAAAENLNPAAGGLLHLLTRTNQYGQHSNSPVLDALRAALSPTPEYQIAESATRGDQSKRMFPATPWDAFLRMLVGPAMPRKINAPAANRAAPREKSGR